MNSIQIAPYCRFILSKGWLLKNKREKSNIELNIKSINETFREI